MRPKGISNYNLMSTVEKHILSKIAKYIKIGKTSTRAVGCV